MAVTLTLGCANVGFVIAGNNTVGGILSQKLDWGDNETRNNTAISSAGVSGLIIGSFVINPILNLIGRRQSIIWTSFGCILGVIPTVFLSLVAILIGKFLFGLAAGGLIVASSLYLNETVPNEHSTSFGFTTNFGVICGIMICLLMSAALPDPKTDPQAAKDDKFWIVISLFPALIGFINMVLWLFVFKLESIKACLASPEGSKYFEQGKLHVSKIYQDNESGSVHRELLNSHRQAN